MNFGTQVLVWRELTGNKLDWLVKRKLSCSKYCSLVAPANKDAVASFNVHIQSKRRRYKGKDYHSIISIPEEFKKRNC